MTDRCVEALELKLPDHGGYVDASLILQCDKPAGHKGVHRHPDPITWSTE